MKDKEPTLQEEYDIVRTKFAELVDRLSEQGEDCINLQRELDYVYKERNRCIAFMTKMITALDSPDTAFIGTHQPVDDDAALCPAVGVARGEGERRRDDDWRNVVVIVIVSTEGTMQLTWHIHNDDWPLFSHLEHKGTDWKWDGHTTDEKYKRMEGW